MTVVKRQNVTLELPALHPKQQIVYNSKAKYKILSCGRRWGKTSLAYVMAVETAVKGGRVWWIAPVSQIANIAWRLISSNLKNLPNIEINITEKRIFLPGGGEIWCKSADNPDNLRGEGLNLAIFDEAAYVKDNVWSEIIQPMLADSLDENGKNNGRAVFISTPNGVGNYFHELWLMGQDKEQNEYESWKFPSISRPSLDKEFVEKVKKSIPKLIFEQEWLGEFVADGQSVFKNIDAICCLNESIPIPGETYFAGIDWGSKNDPTVMAVFNVRNREMVKLFVTHESDFEKQYVDIENIARMYGVSRILVEENAIGIAPFQALRSKGLPVVPFQTTNQSKFEIVSKMIHAMDTYRVKFINDEMLKGELKTYEATRTTTGLWRYAAKGKGHDDRVMATLLAVSLLTTEEIFVPTKLAISTPRVAVIDKEKEIYKHRGGAYPLSHGFR